jgi:hypothetical protein
MPQSTRNNQKRNTPKAVLIGDTARHASGGCHQGMSFRLLIEGLGR